MRKDHPAVRLPKKAANAAKPGKVREMPELAPSTDRPTARNIWKGRGAVPRSRAEMAERKIFR